MGRPAVVPPAGRGRGMDASPRGGVGPTYLHKRCHSVILAGWLAGSRGMGWAGGRLCRPPAGEGGGMRAPVGARGGRKVGRFLRKRRGRCGRLGDPALPGGRRGDLWTERTRSLSGGGRPRGPRRRMEALTVPMFVPAVALDHSDHALSEAKKRAN